MGPRMVSPSRVISAESCEIVLCEVGADGTKAVTVDRKRRRGAATRRRGVIVELSACLDVSMLQCDARGRWTKDRLDLLASAFRSKPR